MYSFGYGTETKGYRLYDPESSRVIYSRDVKFHENEFGIEKELPENEFQVEKRVTLELSSNDDVAENNELNEATILAKIIVGTARVKQNWKFLNKNNP